jgi:hypothetical protein
MASIAPNEVYVRTMQPDSIISRKATELLPLSRVGVSGLASRLLRGHLSRQAQTISLRRASSFWYATKIFSVTRKGSFISGGAPSRAAYVQLLVSKRFSRNNSA